MYRVRDAARSREAILDAATTLFAEHGYDGTSLGAVAAAAGLSRGSPNYFFGSKHQLYVAILELAFASRQEATRHAFEPVRAWCEGEGDLDDLRDAVRAAAEGYTGFLIAQPAFLALVMQEELAGGERLRGRTKRSTAMKDAFSALRALAPDRGIVPFEVDDAILVFVALIFAPMSYRHTLMRAVKRTRRARVELAVDQIMHLVTRT
jgi:AcrR family transcriptional regulator